MLDRFLEGGGSNNDVPTQLYRHTLFQLRQKLDQALIRIGRLDHAAQNHYMASEKFTYRDICFKAEEEWKKIVDENKWAPSKVKTDKQAPPSQFGANQLECTTPECTPIGAPLTKATAFALIQQLQQNSGGTKRGICYNCRKEGHWSRECPEKRSNDTNGNQGGSRTYNRNGPWAWQSTPPDPQDTTCIKLNDSGTLTKWKMEHNGKTFCWYAKCNRWSTTHWTQEHLSSPLASNASLNYLGTPDSDAKWQSCAFYTHATSHATACCDHASSDDDGLASDFASLVFPYLPIALLFIIWVFNSTFAPVLWFSLGWLLTGIR
jgi:hypothetical protein